MCGCPSHVSSQLVGIMADVQLNVLGSIRITVSCDNVSSWWRHQMETFSAILAICAGNSPSTGEFPTQRPVTRSFDVFFDLCLNKWLSKQSLGWWFETPSRPLWCHCNVCHFLWRCHDMEIFHILLALCAGNQPLWWCHDMKSLSTLLAFCAGNPPLWWCHDMETLSTLLALCAGNPPGTGVTGLYDVFVVSLMKILNNRLSCW